MLPRPCARPWPRPVRASRAEPSRPLPSARTCARCTGLSALRPRTEDREPAGGEGGREAASRQWFRVRGSPGPAPWPPSPDLNSGGAGVGSPQPLAPRDPPLCVVLTHLGQTASAPFVKENCAPQGRSALTGHCCPDAAFPRSPSPLPSTLAPGHRRPAPQEAWRKLPPPSAFPPSAAAARFVPAPKPSYPPLLVPLFCALF